MKNVNERQLRLAGSLCFAIVVFLKMLPATSILGQTTVPKQSGVDVNTNSDNASSWYGQPWVWVMGVAIFIILIMVLTRRRK